MQWRMFSYIKTFRRLCIIWKKMQQSGDSFPVLYQEAICLYFAAVNRNPEVFRTYPIETEVYERFVNFLKSVNRLSPETLYEQYGNTYYYYAQFIPTPKVNL